MKNKFLTVLLITATIMTLASCASRKYGCPSTVKTTSHSVETKA